MSFMASGANSLERNPQTDTFDKPKKHTGLWVTLGVLATAGLAIGFDFWKYKGQHCKDLWGKVKEIFGKETPKPNGKTPHEASNPLNNLFNKYCNGHEVSGGVHFQMKCEKKYEYAVEGANLSSPEELLKFIEKMNLPASPYKFPPNSVIPNEQKYIIDFEGAIQSVNIHRNSKKLTELIVPENLSLTEKYEWLFTQAEQNAKDEIKSIFGEYFDRAIIAKNNNQETELNRLLKVIRDGFDTYKKCSEIK